MAKITRTGPDRKAQELILLVKGFTGQYILAYDAIHARPVEFGTEPHMPPVEAIEGWVRRRLGEKDRKKANRIAWAIAIDIKKNGSQPRPFLRPAIDTGKANAFQIFEAGGSLEDLVEFIFNESQENILRGGIIDEGTLLKSGRFQEVTV